jgi:uncharacterized membrane-anchored protein
MSSRMIAIRPSFLSSLILVLSSFCPCLAQQEPSEGESKEVSWVKGLKFEHGEVPIGDGIAKVNVPATFKYLNPADSSKYLTMLGNPPSTVLGILFPETSDLLSDNGWFVVLDYEKEGHIKDDDASKIDYSELLDTMKEESEEINKQRKTQGYPAVNIVGWATSPRYDSGTHKLYWAKELAFDGEAAHTLNYNIRMLGREGVLVANAVGSMQDLSAIETATPEILSMVDFTNGNRYADYNAKTDHTAEYGIAGLIAGAAGLKVAAKVGIFALIAKKFAVLWKFLLVGLLVASRFFKKLFRRKEAV